MTIAALVAGATFAGCTDDENDNKKYDENGNEIVDEPGNTPGGDMELKEKRVARIWYGELENDGTVYYTEGRGFKYIEDRISKVAVLECTGDGAAVETAYEHPVYYETSEVAIYNDYGYAYCTFKMEDGRAVACSYGNGEQIYEEYSYKYANGILSEMTVTHMEDGMVYMEEAAKFDIQDKTWTGAALYVDGEEGSLTFEMSEVENNLSVDLYYAVCHLFSNLEFDRLLGVTGERMKYLPKKVSVTSAGGMATQEFEYTLDEEGYVTEVWRHSDDPTGDPGYETWTEVWKIEYEE